MKYFMARVEQVHLTRRGRFVVLQSEILPKGQYMRRFHLPSESLNIGDRVKLEWTLQPKEPQIPTPEAIAAEGVEA